MSVDTRPATPRAADPAGKTSVRSLERRRQVLTRVLGGLWLVDAALQYQPFMFSRAFPAEVLAPAGHASPSWVAVPGAWAATVVADHVIVANTAFATGQLLIALGLFRRRTVRVALAASIGWALAVWWLGEGVGGLLAGPVSPVMGLPGAALLYALVAVVLWPGRATAGRRVAGRCVAAACALGPRGARLLWLLLWGGFAIEAVLPANSGSNAIPGMIAAMADGEPTPIAAINSWAADLLVGRGAVISLLLAAVFVLTALTVVIPVRLARGVLAVTVAVTALIWVVGEDLGGIATGTATDPNTGPLLVLLALCYWPLSGQLPPVQQPRMSEATS